MPGWVVFLEVVAVIGLIGFGATRFIESLQWPPLIIHPYACECCDRRFKSSSILALHLRAQHQQLQGPLKAKVDAARMLQKRRKAGKTKLRLV